MLDVAQDLNSLQKVQKATPQNKVLEVKLYKVYYYLLNRLQSKMFPSLSEAIHFAVYKVGYGDCGEIIKVK